MLDEDAGRALLTLRVLGGALMGGVVLFGIVVVFLVRRDGYQPAMADAAPSLVPLAGMLTVASLLSAPFIENMLRRIPDGSSRADLLSRYQTAGIVGLAVREAAGLFALMVGLLTGALNWSLGLAALAVLGMLLALPGESRLKGALRELERRSGR